MDQPDIAVLRSGAEIAAEGYEEPKRRPGSLSLCPGCHESMIDPERTDLCSSCRNPHPSGSRVERRFSDIGDNE